MARIKILDKLYPQPMDGKNGTPYRHNLLLNSLFRDADDNHIPKQWNNWSETVSMATLDIDTEGDANVLHITSTKNFSDGDHAKGILQIVDNIKPDTTYTLSMYVKGKGLVNFGFHVLSDNDDIQSQDWLCNHVSTEERTVNSDSWTRYYFSFKTPSVAEKIRAFVGSYTNVFFDAYIMKPKLEEGDGVSEWAPAESEIIGKDGAQGKLGPLAYMAGEWSSVNTYERTDEVAPIVRHNDKYWYQRAAGKSKGDEPTAESKIWKLAQSFDIVIAKLMMAEFGKIASAVFSGDFMLSQYGSLNGKTIGEGNTDDEINAAYKQFDASKPDSGPFIPNLYINFLTGLMRSVKMKAYDMEAHGGSFENVKVSGELNGVSGSFKELYCINKAGEKVGRIAFGSDGKMWFEGDLYNQGWDDTKNRGYRFYSSAIWCRGGFGARERNVLLVLGTKGFYYTNGTYYDGVSVTFEKTTYNNKVCYKLICYGQNDDYSGFPVDTIIFNCTSEYNYVLVAANTQRLLCINANDNVKIFIYSNGNLVAWGGGQMAEVFQVPNNDNFMNPQLGVTVVGAGLMVGAFRDNNW